ncbi:site-specific integrase [Dysgonomonas sp. 25]|uniref:site-specific integrase n=1 Tax=Dysgonomonas sp. 25 TaxID=2302933 RepID=UPI0013D1DC65|nr:site-specific integrase [Dysgonomonas sp. 25]NDV69928.1 site-specific integrase [Dysgonomonas sp. 25]
MKHRMSQFFFIRKSKLNKDGSATIIVKITISGKSLEFSTGLSIQAIELWDSTLRRMRTKRTEAIEINDSLSIIEKKLDNIYSSLYKDNPYVTVKMVSDSFHGKDLKEYTLLDQFDKIIKQKKALSKTTITEHTVGKYECSKKKVGQFIEYYYTKEDLIYKTSNTGNTVDINIKKVDYEFIHNYEIYLLSDGGCGHNTMVRHMRYLKQVLSYSMKCKYITDDPFYGIVLSSKRTNPRYLTEGELTKIIETDLRSEVLDTIRDIFVFACFTALAYIDIQNLKKTDIITDSTDREFIDKNRIKTGNEYFVPLVPAAKQIIEKYKQKKYPDNKLFSVPSGQCINRYLKEIANICGISKNISFHTARHTCATLMLTKGMSIESVSKMLGHSDIQTTQIYAKILNEKVTIEIEEIMKGLPVITKERIEELEVA